MLNNPFDHVRLRGSCPQVKPSSHPDMIVDYVSLMEKLKTTNKDMFASVANSNYLTGRRDGHEICRDICLTYHGFRYSAYLRGETTEMLNGTNGTTSREAERCVCLKSLEDLHHQATTTESQLNFEIYKTGLFGKMTDKNKFCLD